MNGPSMTAPALLDLLKGGTLTGEWVLDPRNSSVRLKSKSMGVIPVKGIFREVSGSGTVSPDGTATGTLLVAAASIDTQNTRRDTHLRSADFFDSDNHPDISFTADDIRPSGQGVAATVPGDGEVWLDAVVHINRADFGLTWNRLGLVSMHNTLTIHAVFTRE